MLMPFFLPFLFVASEVFITSETNIQQQQKFNVVVAVNRFQDEKAFLYLECYKETYISSEMVFYEIGNLVFNWILGFIHEPHDHSNGFQVLGSKIAVGVEAQEKIKSIKIPLPDRTAQWVASQTYENDSDSGYSLTEMVWVENDLGNNCMEVRGNIKPCKLSHFNDTYGGDPCDSFPIITSTPLNDDLHPNIEMPIAMQKIQEMQLEISKLKEQIAKMCQENLEKSSMESSCSQSVPPPPPPPCLLPPPPPPPPPPPVPTICISSPEQKSTKQFMSLGDLIKQKASDGTLRSGLKSTSSNEQNDENSPPSMADVLKNLSSVKLKPVARSPGGTPLRQIPLPCNINDQQSIIANALKKKFARSRAMMSPDNRNAWDTPSPSPSPPRIFGQHLLKKTGAHFN